MTYPLNSCTFSLLAGFALLTSGLSASAAPTADDIITRARALLGTEDQLNGLTTLQYFGDMYDGSDQKVGSIFMEFKKPASQRSEFITANGTEIEATDGFEAWALKIDSNGRKGMAIVQPPQLGAYIDTSYENLFFFHGPQQTRGGVVTLAGEADFHGNKCWKVSFQYSSGLTFTRYFDEQTGELRGTITDLGHTEIIESGKLLAGGISFPDTIKSYSDGKLVRIMRFTHIFVNQPIADEIFEVPTASVLLPDANAPLPSDSAGAAPSAAMPTGVSGAAAPPPADLQAVPAGSAAPGSNNSINVPPATPQTNEQPLMFNIKPTTPSN
jgi:hypothetical protein